MLMIKLSFGYSLLFLPLPTLIKDARRHFVGTVDPVGVVIVDVFSNSFNQIFNSLEAYRSSKLQFE